MGIYFRRFCFCLALVELLCGVAFSQNVCGPLDQSGAPEGGGTFSVEITNRKSCTVPFFIYGTVTPDGTSHMWLFNPCTGESDELPDGDASSAARYLKSVCGQSWASFNATSDNAAAAPAKVVAPKTATTSLPLTGQASQPVILVDVNGDGNPDTIALVSGGVRVQLQSSTGSVISTNTFPLGFRPSTVNSKLIGGDFNGDGKLDLAISYFGDANTGLGGAVFILLGNGDGTFGAPQQVNAGPNPGSLAAADFNGDGKLDLAVANDDTPNVSILTGKGDGTFGSPAVYTTVQNETGSPRALVATDLNGDGLPDLAVDFTDRVFALLNNHGAFGQAIATAVPYSPIYFAYGDLNHDGHMDLALVGLNSLMFLFGNGDGTFQAPISYATGNQPDSLTLIPTQDNYTLVAVPDAFTNNVWFTIVSPDGSTAAPQLFPVPGRPTGIAAADLNGDGKPDIVVTGMPTDLSVLLQGSGGRFLQPAPYTLAPGGAAEPQTPAIGDFNGDGKPDVITGQLQRNRQPVGRQR